MTIHFAAARTGKISPVARILRSGKRVAHCCTAANDNSIGLADDRILHAALRHFALHGLGAANDARVQAEQAFFADDRESYHWWLGICRKLDRRLASECRPNGFADRLAARPDARELQLPA